MKLKSRLFERRAPTKEAKNYFIFCEGHKREYQYFLYFKEIDSKINVVVINPDPHDDNSPTGLYSNAVKCLIKSEENPIPKFELLDIDEVWFVIDTDKWEWKIDELRKLIKEHPNWSIAQSNPCFEVWFYYHFQNSFPSFEGIEESKKWKSFINTHVKGGFDSRKHPILIKTAIQNSTSNYQEVDEKPEIGSTQMHFLAESIYPLIEATIEDALKDENIS